MGHYLLQGLQAGGAALTADGELGREEINATLIAETATRGFFLDYCMCVMQNTWGYCTFQTDNRIPDLPLL